MQTAGGRRAAPAVRGPPPSLPSPCRARSRPALWLAWREGTAIESGAMRWRPCTTNTKPSHRRAAAAGAARARPASPTYSMPALLSLQFHQSDCLRSQACWPCRQPLLSPAAVSADRPAHQQAAAGGAAWAASHGHPELGRAGRQATLAPQPACAMWHCSHSSLILEELLQVAVSSAAGLPCHQCKCAPFP